MANTPTTPNLSSILDTMEVAPKLGRLKDATASSRRPPTVKGKKYQEVKDKLQLAIVQEQPAPPSIIVAASQMKFTMDDMTFKTYDSLKIKAAPDGLFQSWATGPWIEIEPPGVQIAASATVQTIAPELSSSADEAASVWELGLIQALMANEQQIEYENAVIEIRENPMPCLDTSNEASKPWYNRSGVGSVSKSGNTLPYIPLIDRPSIKLPIDFAPRQATAQPATDTSFQSIKVYLVPLPPRSRQRRTCCEPTVARKPLAYGSPRATKCLPMRSFISATLVGERTIRSISTTKASLSCRRAESRARRLHPRARDRTIRRCLPPVRRWTTAKPGCSAPRRSKSASSDLPSGQMT